MTSGPSRYLRGSKMISDRDTPCVGVRWYKPFEQAFSKKKAILRGLGARTEEERL